MVKWEYKTVPLDHEILTRQKRAFQQGLRPVGDTVENALNKYGEQGWELVTLQGSPQIAVMKRPIGGSSTGI